MTQLWQTSPRHPWVWANQIEGVCVEGISCPAHQLKPLKRTDDSPVRAITLNHRGSHKKVLLGAAQKSGDGYRIICWGDQPYPPDDSLEFSIQAVIEALYGFYCDQTTAQTRLRRSMTQAA